MKKPKLLIATDNFLPRWDGVARFLSAVLPGLEEVFDITIIAPDNGHVDDHTYRLIKIPLTKKSIGDFKIPQFKYWLIKKEVKKHDIVFTQTIGSIGALTIVAAKRARKPVISYVHSLEDRLVPMAFGPTPLRKVSYPFMRWLTWYLYNKTSLLLTPSDWVNEQLAWNKIVVPKKVVRLGVDVAKFSPGPRSGVRENFGIAKDDFVIGQHGRLAHEKDLKTLLRSFVRLRAKHKKCKLLIIGDGMSSIKRELQRQPGVVLAGSQNDIVPFIRALDVFVLTSLTETTCLSALEAMSCGIPIVSTPVGFVKDYISEGHNGMFVPFKDAVVLAKKLEWLLENPTIRGEIGERAMLSVHKDFSWDKTTEEIKKVLLEAGKF